MPFCPNCQYEYLEGIELCPECHTPLQPGARPEQEDLPPEYVRLVTLSDPAAAMVFKGTLSEAGIPVIVHTYGPTTGLLATVADDITEDYSVLLVPGDRLEEALRIVQEMESGETDWPAGMEPED
jgi:hypothetical protein